MTNQSLSQMISVKENRSEELSPLPLGRGLGEDLLTAKRAREMRTNSTEAEKRLWSKLRNRQIEGYKFYRQYSIPPYYADFVCRDIDLIIEVDGGQHCESRYDDRRTRYLEDKGYKVIRFWNNDVLGNTEGVLILIQEALQALTPTLSLKGEGEEKENK